MNYVKHGSKENLTTKPVSLMHNYWASEGSQKFPNMARAARVLLSVPASLAVLERDFSTAGRLITASRSRLDSKYVQVVLFLNGSRDIIPDEIPELSETQARCGIPRRLSNPRREVESLSTGSGNGEESGEETADGSDLFDILPNCVP